MKVVTKEEFYNIMNPLDVCVSVEDGCNYPYTTLFKMRNGKLIGKVKSTDKDEQGNRIYPEKQTYLIN